MTLASTWASKKSGKAARPCHPGRRTFLPKNARAQEPYGIPEGRGPEAMRLATLAGHRACDQGPTRAIGRAAALDVVDSNVARLGLCHSPNLSGLQHPEVFTPRLAGGIESSARGVSRAFAAHGPRTQTRRPTCALRPLP